MNTEHAKWIEYGILKQAKYLAIGCSGRIDGNDYCNGWTCYDHPIYCNSWEEAHNRLAQEKNHHGMIDLDDYNKKNMKEPNNRIAQEKDHRGMIDLDDYNKKNAKGPNKERKYGHMQLRDLNKKD